MTIVYAESSGVLAWLLGEPVQDAVREILTAADEVVTSALTAVECGRGLQRARLDRRISAAHETTVMRFLDDALAGWHVVDLSDDVIDKARGTFPHEPTRTLDAIHVASAMLLQRAVGELDVLSLDDRVRANVQALGMRVVPTSIHSAAR
ncbi:MAG TPA: type II toxin-antitoxin system VapC family toxin [Gemmatimonadaceae bacterium]|jgi:uncharacterized protein with PIN domain